MSAMREKDQADFDLERFVDMFDEALTSQDPRVIDTLRSLMMIVTLTKPESRQRLIEDRQQGPLRRLFDDVRQAHRRCSDLEDTLKILLREQSKSMSADPWAEKEYAAKSAVMMAQDIDQSIIQKLQQDIPSLSKNLTKKIISGG